MAVKKHPGPSCVDAEGNLKGLDGEHESTLSVCNGRGLTGVTNRKKKA